LRADNKAIYLSITTRREQIKRGRFGNREIEKNLCFRLEM